MHRKGAVARKNYSRVFLFFVFVFVLPDFPGFPGFPDILDIPDIPGFPVFPGFPGGLLFVPHGIYGLDAHGSPCGGEAGEGAECT